jgi:hypothetical protein
MDIMTRRNVLLASTALFVLPLARANPGWKLDADGKIEMKDGNPVWIDANGGEQVLGGDTISRLNGEAKTLRLRAEAAETALAPFKDIDPAKAREALDTVSKIDAKKLIDAGEVDKGRDEISKGFNDKITELNNGIAERDGKISTMTVDTAFATSKYMADHIAVPPEMFKATFANRFKVENGKLVPYGPDGNKLYSKQKMGEVADFDEALGLLVDQSPYKDQILKAPSASGSGNGGGGGVRPGSRSMRRSEFEALPPVKQAEAAGLQSSGELSIVD